MMKTFPERKYGFQNIFWFIYLGIKVPNIDNKYYKQKYQFENETFEGQRNFKVCFIKMNNYKKIHDQNESYSEEIRSFGQLNTISNILKIHCNEAYCIL